MENRNDIVEWYSQCVYEYSPIKIIYDTCVLIAEFTTYSKYNELLYKKSRFNRFLGEYSFLSDNALFKCMQDR